MVIPSIAADPQLKRLRDRITTQPAVVHVSGVWGSAAPLIAAETARHAPRTYLYVVAHAEQADNARDDLELFLDRSCELLPAFETLPGEGAASGEVEAERLRICGLLAADRGKSLPQAAS